MNEKVQENQNKSSIIYKILFVSIIATVVVLLFFLFKDIIIEIIKYTKADDQEAIKTLMREKGWFGYLTVIIVEALEMVVICIPAEFIQIPAGISFHPLISILLCDLGVCLGASIIYFIVHVLKLNNDYLKNKQKRINSIASKKNDQNTQILMYFLFVTPIIPFGAICYFASNKKISYGRYIFTCATGVLPSIVTSIFMGAGVKLFISNNLPIWALILIIFGLGAILFIGMFLIAKRYIFKGKKIKNTPNSLWSYIILFCFGLYTNLHSKVEYIEDEKYDELLGMKSPILFLSNHMSSHDIYAGFKYLYPIRPALISNRYYTRSWFTRWGIKILGFIPKGLFNPDVEALRKVFKYKNDEISIYMFPEGRLSIDGTTYPLTNGTAALAKKLDIPVVILKMQGTYLASSKWRTAKGRKKVTIGVERIIKKEELENLSISELDNILTESLKHNEFDYALTRKYKDNNKAEGLESVLYKCPHCLENYKLKGEKNTLSCECGFSLTLDEHFRFNDNEYGLHNIHDYYEWMKAEERKFIDSLDDDIVIEQEVDVKKINFIDKKKDILGEGVCRMTKDIFSFTGTIGGENLSFTHTHKSLQALAFSVNDEYECYHENELYYFYPKENKLSCTRVALLYDILEEEYQKQINNKE